MAPTTDPIDAKEQPQAPQAEPASLHRSRVPDQTQDTALVVVWDPVVIGKGKIRCGADVTISSPAMAFSSDELNNANEQPQAKAAPLNRINENRYENGAVHNEPITYGGGIIRYGSATKVPVPEPTASAEGGYAAAPGNLQASWTAFMRGLETYEEAESYLFEMEKRMKKKFPTTMPGEGQTLGATGSCSRARAQDPTEPAQMGQ